MIKGILGSFLAAVGMSCGKAGPGKSRVEVADSDFPYPLFTVQGAHALAEWQSLREEGTGYPVVIGNEENLSMITDMLGFDDRPPAEDILATAADLDFPRFLHDLRRAEEAEFRAKYPEDYAAEVAEGFHQEPLGEWPEVPPASPALTVHEDILTGMPFDQVYIAVLPTTDGWKVPAYLSWGGWNANPGPEVHVAALKSWYERYGAELIGMSGEVLNLRVARKPQSREEALALAREQYDYCSDIVDQGVATISNLAASLVDADWWYFWWD